MKVIVDFVCMRHRLVVDVDGGQHNFDAHRARDVRRDSEFNSAGFRVLRFWNNDVDQNLSGVLHTIDAALNGDAPHPAASGGHPPPSGEG